MTAVLKSAPGVLVAVRTGKDDNAPSAGLLQIGGLSGAGHDVIISDLSIDANAAAQVTPTIGGPHYIYSLGQNLENIVVRLVTYPATCDAGGANGVQRAWSFYHKNRVSPENVTPISLTFSGMTLHAFVFGMATRAESSNGIPVVVLELKMQGWVDPSTVEQPAVSLSPAERQRRDEARRLDRFGARRLNQYRQETGAAYVPVSGLLAALGGGAT